MVAMTPYTVLDTWKWGAKGRYASKIGRSLTHITFNDFKLVPFENHEIRRNENAAWFDYDLHAEVRMTAEKHSEGTGWHQDGDTSTSNMNCALVLWASAEPTEFKLADTSKAISVGGELHIPTWQPEPFELVIAKNLDVFHRRPDSAHGIKRFIFRQRVEVPEWL